MWQKTCRRVALDMEIPPYISTELLQVPVLFSTVLFAKYNLALVGDGTFQPGLCRWYSPIKTGSLAVLKEFCCSLH